MEWAMMSGRRGHRHKTDRRRLEHAIAVRAVTFTFLVKLTLSSRDRPGRNPYMGLLT